MEKLIVLASIYFDAIQKIAKYENISFKPPQSVANNAKKGLELRKKNKGKGGLNTQQAKSEGVGSGVARAVNLKNRDELSPSTVKRMKAFFDRHEKSKKVDKGKDPSEDKGRIAWLLWGGDAGQAWANKVVKQMETADNKKKATAKRKDFMPGGLADSKSEDDFNPKALAKGTKVELEHTDSKKKAKEIAMDHLTEDPKYYDKLEKMEKKD